MRLIAWRAATRWRLTIASNRKSVPRARRRILRQGDMLAEGGFQAFDRARFIAAACTAADADSADHLAIHHDRNAARIREETKLIQLSRHAFRIIPQLRRSD